MKIRATMTLRNAKLIEARQSHGLSQIAAADLAAIPTPALAQLEAMDFTNQRVLEHAERIATVLELSVEDVVPAEAIGKALLNRAVATSEISPLALESACRRLEAQVSSPPLDRLLETESKEEAGQMVRNAMSRLTHRERVVVELRYGLKNGLIYTISECGRILGVTQERVRQIQARAERRLAFHVARDQRDRA